MTGTYHPYDASCGCAHCYYKANPTDPSSFSTVGKLHLPSGRECVIDRWDLRSTAECRAIITAFERLRAEGARVTQFVWFRPGYGNDQPRWDVTDVTNGPQEGAVLVGHVNYLTGWHSGPPCAKTKAFAAEHGWKL